MKTLHFLHLYIVLSYGKKVPAGNHNTMLSKVLMLTECWTEPTIMSPEVDTPHHQWSSGSTPLYHSVAPTGDYPDYRVVSSTE